MSRCLCCQGSLLRHIRRGGVYWYCSSCRQEMLSARLEDAAIERYASNSTNKVGTNHLATVV